jgi:hypothetical protein
MHYLTHRSNALFMETALGPPKHEKKVHQHFTAQTHWNALHDPHILPDAKTQVRCNVTRHAFYGNCTGPIKHEKIVRRCFAPQTQWNALRDPQIPPNAKTQVRRNVS